MIASSNSHSKVDQRKAGELFNAGARADEQSKMAELHGAEIDMVTVWAQAVAESQNIKMDIGSALLHE